MTTEAARLNALGRDAVADGDLPRALELFQQAIAAPDATPTDIATSTKDRGVTFAKAKRFEEALACFEAVIEGFGDATDTAIRLAYFKALYNKGGVLADNGRVEEALRSFNGLLQRSLEKNDPALHDVIADTLYRKADALLKDPATVTQAIACLELLARKFGSSADLAVRHTTAKALMRKAVELALHESLLNVPRRQEKAIECLDQAAAMLKGADDYPSLLLISDALRAKADILRGQNREAEAQACYDPRALAPIFGEANAARIVSFMEANDNLMRLAATQNRPRSS